MLFLILLHIRRDRVKYNDAIKNICSRNMTFRKDDFIKCVETIESIKADAYRKAFETLYDILSVSTKNNENTVTLESIPDWVVEALKVLLKKVISYIIDNYAVEISWTQNYRNEYKACIISLVHKSNNNKITSLYDTEFDKFKNSVTNAVQRYIGSKFSVHLAAEMYEGNPSVIIYWS